ncbi:MAG: helix-turn-helix transcriptional regulator [Spirochaetales bacterium]|nr:helix-turn-helix transcriptional regulator [Spirochaetales bacterium]
MKSIFLLYNVISLLLGSAATAVVLVLYLKTRNRRLAAFLWADFFVAIIVVVVTLDLYWLLSGYNGERIPLWNSIHFSCCGLSFWIPRTCRRSEASRRERTVERVFSVSAMILAAALAAYYLFLQDVYRLFLVLYVLIYADLSLACVYFAYQLLQSRKKSVPAISQLRYYQAGLHLSGWALAILLPLFLITDFFGWLLPFISSILDRNFTLLPAFYFCMSLFVLFGSILEILEPSLELEPVEPDELFTAKYGLTKRETEIAPLVLKCLTYEQIGNRLFISPGTVRTHLVHIYGKTGTKNRLELSALIQAEQRQRETQ